MRTKVYRRQHAALRTLLDETSSHLVPLDADACRIGLAKLARLLGTHLALEDRALYPRLMTHDDPAVRRAAIKYQASMGRLRPAFDAFHDRWSRCDAIEAAAHEFTAAFRVIAAALRQRMDFEDAHLYRMIDEPIRSKS
ncbi:MAG TPA: hemerythrin domain-containing protein [Candidatus Baltobacteraceae bacterium]|nr:hemerythrin domain-containing protein [Candidatus Baltobacteraceae bacterium]